MVITIDNGYLSISFDERTGELVSLLNRLTGDEAVKHKTAQPLFKLYARERGVKEGERTALLPGAVRSAAVGEADAGGARKLTLELEDAAVADDGDGAGASLRLMARITVELAADSSESVWTLELENRDAGYDIVEVLFPYVRGLGLGDRWDDDTLVYPHHAGEKTDNPVAQYASEKYRKFWRAESVAEPDGTYSREINYCGLASMTWMYLYDREHGLYFGSHDERFPLTGLRVETGGPEQPWMGFAFRKYTVIREGRTWSSGPAVIALTDRDWHWGAKRYRQWIDRHIDMPAHPEFLSREYVLNQCYNFKRGDDIASRFADIPAMFQAGREQYGMNHMFIASWNRKGFDRDYPEYQPDMELGTPWELYEGVRAVNDGGGFVTFYINARIFDKDHDFFPTLGTKWAIKDHNQAFMNETYGPVEFTVSCPSHDEWQQYIVDTARWMVRSYGATGIYLDQLGSADPYPCYDADHSHGDIGEFNTGYLHVLRELLPEVRRLNPDGFLMIENCGDIYGSYVWGNLTWNGERYDEFFNMYKYTFPEYVQVNMVNPRRELEGEAQETKLRWDIARATLIGSVFWIGMYRFAGEGNAGMRRFLERSLALRAELQPYIAQGVYADAEGVRAAAEGLDVARWRLADGSDLYIVSNLDGREGAYFEAELTDDAHAAMEMVWGGDMDGDTRPQPVACTALDGALRVPVPPAAISYRLVRRRGEEVRQ
ncbi:hypothetical protein SAMN02799630_05556 [Paenibacillus sp. UNCCL117]|uniref:DUF6259 domain-containing protein n=1 Tax=unclassified Paenibacillus TaxID=185978 RepID=UPI00088AE3D4|nr:MULTISPECIES: DUF6259 domain-containing protein [unclassified Paenibacillus]SDE49237.1 hypothetical protein SAMN04488602_13035 [Paenibacillus sp. cl123]SFW66839.1 hypothetical protein SAMN02799630_05556 [Paenibacillus sp. UNCCL117]